MNSKKRWTASRKADLVLSLIKGKKQLVDVCRKYDLKQSEVEGWTQDFLDAGEKKLKTLNPEKGPLNREKQNGRRGPIHLLFWYFLT